MKTIGWTLGSVLMIVAAGCGQAPAPGSASSGDSSFEASLEATLASAAERETVTVVDFYTDWCKYCAQFDADAEDDETLRAALGGVALQRIDAEEGDGEELATRYEVSGYPTFVVLNTAGDVISRWSGYEDPAEFIGKLEAAVADPTTVAEKLERFATTPTAELAATIARIHDSRGRHAEAFDLFREAQRLDPDAAGTYAVDVFWSSYYAARDDDEFPYEELRAAAQEAIASGTTELADRMLVARVAAGRAVDAGDLEAVATLLTPMLEASAASDDAQIVKERRRLEILSALHVEDDPQRAIKLKRESMEDGWQDDAGQLNAFAWWCFENKVNLEEAERLARRGAELAESDTERAMILDTAAELCHLRGNCTDALELIRAALAADPDSEHYARQQERFQQECAG